MNAVKPECSTGVVDDAPTVTCHSHAMVAKESIFRAQDFGQRIGDAKLRDRAHALLWRARAALEELDNVITDARERARGR